MSARIGAGSGFTLFLCFVLIDVSTEKSCSHKYVDGNGRRCEMEMIIQCLSRNNIFSRVRGYS
jgi:hypothetical protein